MVCWHNINSSLLYLPLWCFVSQPDWKDGLVHLQTRKMEFTDFSSNLLLCTSSWKKKRWLRSSFEMIFLSTTQADIPISQGSFTARGGLSSLKTKFSLLWRKKKSSLVHTENKQTLHAPDFYFLALFQEKNCLRDQTVITSDKSLWRVIFPLQSTETC